MQKIVTTFKNTKVLAAILAIALLSVGLYANNHAKSAVCPQLAPTHPQFDVFPVSYDPSLDCVDASQIDAFTVGAAGRDGRFAQSQTEHDAGINASANDTVEISVFFHNGASDQVNRALTTAINTRLSTSFSTASTADHVFSSSISADNAATVTSATRGGSIVVHTSTPTTVSYVPGSSSICVSLQHAQERVGVAAAAALPNCGFSGTDKQIAMPDGIANGMVSLGDLKACFPYSGTFDFKVKINQPAPPPVQNTTLSITKNVLNLTLGQANFLNTTGAKQGDTVQYQVVVKNTGSNSANSVVLNDPGAAGLSNGNFPTNLSLGTLFPAETRTVTYQATVAIATGTITNTARATASNAPTVSDSAIVNVTQPQPQQGQLSITKKVLNLSKGETQFQKQTTARQGDTVQYQVTVTNSGMVDLTNVIVNDPGATGLSGNNFPNQLNLGNLLHGQSLNINYSATVTASSGTIVNTATVSAPNTPTSSDSATVVVSTPQPQQGTLSVVKQVLNQSAGQANFASSTTARQGDTVAYKVTVTNTSSVTVNSVVANDPGAAGLSGSNFPNNFSLGTLFAGQTATLNYSAVVTASSGTITNTVTITASNAGSVQSSAAVTVNVQPQQGQLTITKKVLNLTAGQAVFQNSVNANQNDTVQYQLTITNSGNVDLTNVIVNDPGVAGLVSNNFPNQLNLGNLLHGQTLNVNYSAIVTASSGTIVNTATVSAPNTPSASASATVIVSGQPPVNNAQIAITKKVLNLSKGETAFQNQTTARQGDLVMYQVTVSNTGNVDLTNVIVNDPGATGLSSNNFPNQLNLGNLLRGQSLNISYSASVTASSGTITNTATATAPGASQVQASASVVVSTPVPQNGAITLSKGVANISQGNFAFSPSVNASNGDTVQFQITVNNNSGVTLNNVSITDNLPAGLNFVPNSMSVSGGISNPNSLLNISLGTLNSGQNIIITFNATVTQTGTLVNTVTASAANANTVTAQARVFVQQQQVCNNLAVSKLVKNLSQNGSSFSKSVTANPNDRIQFQITVVPQFCDATNVRVTDSLPQQFNFASGSVRLNGNSASDSIVQGGSNIGTVARGSTATIVFEGNVANITAAGQTVLTNNVIVSADNSASVNDNATIFVNVNPPNQFSQLQITKLARNISFGNVLQKNITSFQNDRVGFQITVSNTGSVAVNNVTVNDTLPGGFNLAGGTTRLDGQTVTDVSQGTLFFGQMQPGQQHTVTFEGNVNAAAGSTLQNTAFARGDNAGQVQDSATVVVNSNVQGATVNLVMSKRAFNDTKNADATAVTATREDFITYTLTVVNTGNAPANNFVIQDDLSSVLNLATLADNGGGTLNGTVLSWPAVNIQPNSTITKTFRVRINFFLPTNTSLNLINTFGNTVTVHIGQVEGNFVAPKTGPGADIAYAFGGIVTALFAVFRRKDLLGRLMARMPKVKFK